MAETAKLSAVAVWIRLLGLPIEYYEPSVLRDIGRAIGPMLRIDTQTATEAKGVWKILINTLSSLSRLEVFVNQCSMKE